ncbi:hypothetical protein C8J57DRAFT_1464540 [Mycena rebaudengoi]|nr:hypothetical protein C8J57DRAFT_1464540 [Mycena rebaudengoi]
MSETPATPNFQGAIAKLKKVELKAICNALDINDKGNKEDLIPRIDQKLFGISGDSTEFAEDPRFKNLYLHRQEHPTKPKKGSQTRSSATRTAEDLADQANPSKALSGYFFIACPPFRLTQFSSANLKLQEQKVTTDPPGSFKRLGLQGKINSPSSPLASLTESSPPASVKGDPAKSDNEDENEEEEEEKEEKDVQMPDVQMPKKAHAGVVLKVRDQQGQAATRELHIKDVPIDFNKTPGGSVEPAVLLSKLIPMALETSSPLKADKAGRFSRRGVTDPTTIVNIGTVAQHMDGPLPRALSFDRVDKLALEPIEDGLFGAEVLFAPSITQTVPGPLTCLTGAGTDRPLDIARARSSIKAVPPSKMPLNEETYGFIRCIFQLDPLEQKTSKTADIARLNYNAFQEFLKNFQSLDWDAPDHVKTSYEDWKNDSNKSFTKDDIIRAAGLTPSATNGNNKLFRIAIRLGSSELRRWAQQDQDDGEQLEEEERKRLQELYGDLPYKEFSEEMKAMEKAEKEKKEKAKQKKKAKAAKNAGPSKGHKCHRDGDDEAESERKQKKKKGKGKAKEVLSDDLEEAESSVASDSD